MLGNSLLATASVALCLVVAEGVTRWIDGVPLLPLHLPPALGAMGLDTTARHLDGIPRAHGVDRAWFNTYPPPLPNRGQRAPWTVGAGADDVDAPVDFSPRFRDSDYFKAWNSAFVGSEPCKSPFFKGAPGRLIVFDPPDGEPNPIYRFLPNTTTPLGLVTNQFGFRGPPAEFKRRPDTVRIVFVGASTTAETHAAPWAGPELMGHWLGLWAAANRPDIQFEVLNAGRESIASNDIAAIVRQEVLPLRPDLVVYYEGHNQFAISSLVNDLPADRPAPRPDDAVTRWLREASAFSEIARRASALWNATELGGGAEPPKPPYRIDWPAGLDERDPDIDRADLPLRLNEIVRDLDAMREVLGAHGSVLAVSSFMWMVKDGMVLDPVRHRVLYSYLNEFRFPFTYRDIERLAAFQNRVFAKYAATRGLPFIDVVRFMPADPDLFADAIHNTAAGIRMRAWVVLQQLLPIIEANLAGGAWPRKPPPMPDAHPAFIQPPRMITVDCKSGSE